MRGNLLDWEAGRLELLGRGWGVLWFENLVMERKTMGHLCLGGGTFIQS